VGPNAVELILTGDMERKHPVFPVSLIKKYNSPDENQFHQKTDITIPAFTPEAEKKFLKILREKRVKNKDNKDVVLYLVRYKHQGADSDEWLPADKVPNAKVTLRAYRASKRDHKPAEGV
jgi:hypothetical protein